MEKRTNLFPKISTQEGGGGEAGLPGSHNKVSEFW